MVNKDVTRYDLVKYYEYCKEKKLEILKFLNLTNYRDMRISVLFDELDTQGQQIVSNIHDAINTLDKLEKEVDIIVGSSANLTLILEKTEEFAKKLDEGYKYMEYLNGFIKLRSSKNNK